MGRWWDVYGSTILFSRIKSHPSAVNHGHADVSPKLKEARVSEEGLCHSSKWLKILAAGRYSLPRLD
jgi:hypothetical protein